MSDDARAQVEQLIADAEAAIPIDIMPDLPPGKFTGNAPEWYGFEQHIWANGEAIRKLILKKKSLQNDDELQSAFVRIGTNRNAKRGRQSFVMLLGYKCCQKHASQIRSQLEDPDVAGHVIDTLLKMQVTDYADAVRPFLDHQLPWIRNKAKAYCQHYG